MGGEYIIDNYLDWLYSDEYVYNEDTKEWIYIGNEGKLIT